MRQRFAIFPVLAIGLLAAVIACGRMPSISSGRTVVVYCSPDQEYSEPILKEFEARTGIKVKAVYDIEATKTTGMVTRLIAEKNRPQADVFWNGEPVQTLKLKQEGVLAPYRSPQAASLPADYRDSENCWAAFGGRARVLLVNTKYLPPDQYPTSLFDFGKNKWRQDKTGVALPLFGTSLTHAAALYEVLGPKKALEFYRNLKATGVRIYDGNSVVRDQVANGYILFGLTDNDDAEGAVRAGAPVKVIVPDQKGLGTFMLPNTVSLVAGAPHPEEAKALIDYLLSPEVEVKLIQAGYFGYPCRALPGYDSAPLVKRYQVDYARLPQWLDRAQTELKDVFLK